MIGGYSHTVMAADPVALARALLRCPSVTPAEGGALGVLERALKDAGFTVHRMTFAEPGSAPVENAVLVARDGHVQAIRGSGGATPASAGSVVDARGKFIIPGLISAHAHVSDVNGLKPRAYTAENTMRQLGVFARYGITTRCTSVMS